MSHRRRMVLSWVTLVAIGVVTMLAWRVELVDEEWLGLGWTDYTHWAPLTGTLTLILWTVVVNGSLRARRRLFLGVCLLVASVTCYAIGTTNFYLVFQMPRETFFGSKFTPAWLDTIALIWAVVSQATVPVLVALFGWMGGVRPRWGRLAASYTVYLLSGPAAMGLLWVTKHPGGTDFIDTIRSGFLIPFLVVALGILFLPRDQAARDGRNSSRRDAGDADISPGGRVTG